MVSDLINLLVEKLIGTVLILVSPLSLLNFSCILFLDVILSRFLEKSESFFLFWPPFYSFLSFWMRTTEQVPQLDSNLFFYLFKNHVLRIRFWIMFYQVPQLCLCANISVMF